jgi:Ca2+-binding EF-hand superfamily protein
MNDRLRLVPVLIATFLALCGMVQGEERKQVTSSVDGFFERLDTNRDGKVTLDEAPKQGKMLVEFLLRQSGKKVSDQLDRAEFRRLDQNSNGFIEANELGELHQRRLNDPKSMKERLKSGDVPKPPKDKRPTGLGETSEKK